MSLPAPTAHLPITAYSADATATCGAAAAAADSSDEARGSGRYGERGGGRQGTLESSSRGVGLLRAFVQHYDGIGTTRCRKVVLAPGGAVRSEGMVVLDSTCVLGG